ncbi:MAG: DNA-binding response OmpR family regulator [Ilumatobacter sp.]
MTHRILIVEDDRTIATAIRERLEAEGFMCDTAANGPDAFGQAAAAHPDLVVLDLMLPGIDGVEVCRRLQATRPTPVLMLTARSEESDMLVGLGVGADDYMTKPFSQKELVARIRSVLRRVEITQSAADPARPATITIGDVAIDTERRTVERDAVAVVLTATEFDLIVNLVQHGGAVRTRRQLLFEVWGHRDGSGDRTVDSHVRSIRRKLGDRMVRTVHGVGYAAAMDSQA